MATLVEVQVATAIALSGIAIGWRGGMRHLWGFFDTETTLRGLFWGILAGAVLAFLLEFFALRPVALVIAEEGVLPIDIAFAFGALVALASSALTLIYLSRRRIRQANTAPTTGWLWGLGIGATLASRIGVRAFELGGWPYGISLTVAFAVVAPWSEAIIASGQGAALLGGRRWLPLFWATVARTFVGVAMVASLWQPWTLLFIPALLFWGQARADNVWLPLSLMPRAQQRYRRVVSQAKRRDSLAEARKARWAALREQE